MDTQLHTASHRQAMSTETVQSPGNGLSASCTDTARLRPMAAFLSAVVLFVVAAYIQRVVGLSLHPVLHLVLPLCISALVSALVCGLIVRTQSWHARFSMDPTHGLVQKSHQNAVPRVGGIALLLGLIAGVLVYWGLSGSSTDLRWPSVQGPVEPGHFNWMLPGLVLCGLPAFLAGLSEDLTKRISVRSRLWATLISGFLPACLLGVWLNRLDIPWVDQMMIYPVVGILFTAMAVGGMANAINIIDGFNGLAGGAVILVALGFAGLSLQVGDTFLLLISLMLVACMAGFLLFNFPAAKLFLGDGGAYLAGYLLAEIAVLFVLRHPDVSCWTVLTLLSYPVLEVIFSIGRRCVTGLPAGAPDRGHLHQRVQALIERLMNSSGQPVHQFVNPQTSPPIWLCIALTVWAALWAHADTQSNLQSVVPAAVHAFAPVGVATGFPSAFWVFAGSATLYALAFASVCALNRRLEKKLQSSAYTPTPLSTHQVRP